MTQNLEDIKDIPEERIKSMQEYARELRTKYPKMKMERITRKVAEKFHVKLIAQVKREAPAVPTNTPES